MAKTREKKSEKVSEKMRPLRIDDKDSGVYLPLKANGSKTNGELKWKFQEAFSFFILI